MKATRIHKPWAFTLVELLLVILVILIVLSLFPVSFGNGRVHAQRITCVNNLKQIGLAYRVWPSDQASLWPAQQSAALGGWKDILTNADQGFLVWTNYALMANELGMNPKIIVCPADERKPADTFSNLHSDLNVSYFVGASANDEEPTSLLGGDRNLAPGAVSKDDYGYSPASGQGNDVAIQTNTQASPVCWSLKIHSHGKTTGAGNILLGDGSVQQVTSGSLRLTWLPLAGGTNNWRPELGETGNWPSHYVPSSPSIRVLFP
jgi:type II secretory pathway pseudopilin PulG